MAEHWSNWLEHESGPLSVEQDVICVLLVHNEARILQDFFDHHTALGDMHFVIIDDRSTDHSREICARQPNLTLFAPRKDSLYSKHKRWWRASLLDAFAEGKWCLCPDADERLVWLDYEHQSLTELLARLDAEGARALIADMIDMYDDRPLAEQVAAPDRPLIEQFPYFDDPGRDPFNYRTMMVPKVRFRRRFPTPHTESFGGMRDRIFGRGIGAHGPLARILLKDSMTRPRTIPANWRPWRAAEAKLLKPRSGTYPLVITKLALVKWAKGMFFSGGSHHLSQDVPVSAELAAYLHFPITNGQEGIDYLIARGQHAGGSKYYVEAREKMDTISGTPLYDGSSRYTNSRDLAALLKGPQGA